MPRTISADDLDFSDEASSVVYSDSLRFVLPVPKLTGGGEPLVPPKGEKASDAFRDARGRPIKGRGIVFFNPDDDCWQAAPGDGSAVIILSPIDESQGATLLARAKDLAPDPAALSLEGLKALVRYAIEGLGVRAAYNSSRTFVADRMTPFDEVAAASGLGLHWRRAGDPCHAVRLLGDGAFRGPAATPQTFKGGAVVVQQDDDIRLVQPDSFEAMYRLPDGRRAKASDLKVQTPK